MAASFSSHRNTDKHARKIRKNPQSSQEKNDLYPPYCKHRTFPITLREWESVQRRTSLEGRTGSWYEKLLSFCAVCGWVLRGSGAAVRTWRELESRRWMPGTASVEGLALHNTLLLRSPSAMTSPLSLRSLTLCALPSATVSRVLSAHSLNALSLVSTSRFRNKSKLDLDTNLAGKVHTCTSYENSKTLSLCLCAMCFIKFSFYLSASILPHAKLHPYDRCKLSCRPSSSRGETQLLRRPKLRLRIGTWIQRGFKAPQSNRPSLINPHCCCLQYRTNDSSYNPMQTRETPHWSKHANEN